MSRLTESAIEDFAVKLVAIKDKKRCMIQKYTMFFLDF